MGTHSSIASVSTSSSFSSVSAQRNLQPVGSSISAVLEGPAWKQSRHLQQWRRRWLTLTAQDLRCYKDGGAVTEIILTRDMRRICCGDAARQKPGCVCIGAGGRE